MNYFLTVSCLCQLYMCNVPAWGCLHMSLFGYKPICHLLYSQLPLRSRGPCGALNALRKLMSLVVNLVPVTYNSPCQNREGGHDSSPWSPTLLDCKKPTGMRSFFFSFHWLTFIEEGCTVCWNRFTSVAI